MTARRERGLAGSKDSGSRRANPLLAEGPGSPPRSRAGGSRGSGTADSVLDVEQDPLGRMALYSSHSPPPALGRLFVDCSSCHRQTPVALREPVRAALPISLHLPIPWIHHSWMRCPSCGRRTWVRVRLRLG